MRLDFNWRSVCLSKCIIYEWRQRAAVNCGGEGGGGLIKVREAATDDRPERCLKCVGIQILIIGTPADLSITIRSVCQ